MANNETKESKTSFSERIKRAYRRGYVNGFDDSERMGKQGSKFWSSRGYSKGYGDRKKISKIQNKAKKYRETK